MEIVEVERKYTHLAIHDDTLTFETCVETFYIDDKHKDSLPSCCTIIGVNNNADIAPITLEYLLESSELCRPLDYVHNAPPTQKHVFECSLSVAHTIKVSTSNGPAKSYTSDMVEKRYFEATLEDFEKFRLSDLESIQTIHVIHDVGDKVITTLEKCINAPRVIHHPGELAEVPTWANGGSVTLDNAPPATATPTSPTIAPMKSKVTPEAQGLPKTPVRKVISDDREPVLLLEDRNVSLQNEVRYLQNVIKNMSTESREPTATTTPNESREPVAKMTENVIINFKQSAAPLSKTYNFEESLHSFTLDIICVYLKGQKLLYIEAKVYCEQYLYALMLPAILITAICSVISIALNSYTFGGIIVSCFTAVNSFILSLITYLKLDAKAEAHKMTAYSFEKLQSVCEFSSGRILFSDPKLKLLEIMDDIGNQVKDIKEKNQFILPEAIRHKFPILYSTNVFSEVKRIQNREIILMNTMNNLMNEGKMLQKRHDEGDETVNLKANIEEQDKVFVELIHHRKRYIDIDNDFKKEIEANIMISERYQNKCCQWLKN